MVSRPATGTGAELPAAFLWDLQTDTIVMSTAGYRLYCAEPSVDTGQFTPARLRAQVVGDDRPRWDALVRRARKTHESFVYQHRIVAGGQVRTLVVSMSPVRAPGPAVSHLAATAIDLTEATRGPSLSDELSIDDLQRQIDNLRLAVQSRDVIGQAKGILMSRHHLSADQAFAMLVAASQHTNAKLIQVATEVAETGELDVRQTRRIALA